MKLSLHRLGFRSGPLPLVVLLSILAACDGSPADLAQELNAAREGCTEEMLKAADEECVQMFETYAAMGADAIETYIGGMRAFDEAIQRRGGFQFDTVGLGRAFSTRLTPAGSDSLAPVWSGVRPTLSGEPSSASGAARAEEWLEQGPAYAAPQSTGRWADTPPVSDPAWAAPQQPVDGAAGGTIAPTGRRPVPARGALLPPEERLRRPWIDDEVADVPYVDDAPPRGDDSRRRPMPEETELGTNPYVDPSRGGWD